MKNKLPILMIIAFGSCMDVQAQRVPVIDQIDLPHDYYYRELYVPQLTSGPSSVAWSPDGNSLVYSMEGSLWLQELDSEIANQLTDGDGYDYQPDWSPDGNQIVFTRYNGKSLELMLIDLPGREEIALTDNQAVNVEPRWSPDGKKIAFVTSKDAGHFLLYQAGVQQNELVNPECLTPERQSYVKRYYYSPYDHAINPVWTPDGKKIYFISNREIAHGTGDIVSMTLGAGELPETIHHEETSWRTRPDISPDGTRIVYSSYLGRQWQQLWLIPIEGGYPIPLTYGDYDNTSPRWSPDGNQIAFISNRTGNTSLWLIDAYTGRQTPVGIGEKHYLNSRKRLRIEVRDENGRQVAARLSVTDSGDKIFAPEGAWIHSDDASYPAYQKYETQYFHMVGECEVMVPSDVLNITATHGPEYEIAKIEVDFSHDISNPVVIQLKRLDLPEDFNKYWTGDLHVHMNYTGHYRNTPENLVRQARAEDLNFIFNLIVNKEQRIPDINYFSPDPDPASTDQTLILHAQEYHTSFWGHMGFLGLLQHYFLPDYAGYPHTAVESLYPHNPYIARKVREQGALVGYVHPFYDQSLYPQQSETLFNDVPVNAALGNVDYYEVIGFSHHIASADVWHKMLNCGIRISAGAGSDAMANYASLRGPVGIDRVYVRGEGSPDKETILRNIKAGRGFVTNGPLIGLTVNGEEPGGIIRMENDKQVINYRAWLRSAVPVDFFELVWNGEVIAKHDLRESKTEADLSGQVEVDGPGWMLIRAGSREAHPDILDFYPYATTNPIYFEHPEKEVKSKSAAEYFLIWIDRLEKAAKEFQYYRTDEERELILEDMGKARRFYEECRDSATIP